MKPNEVQPRPRHQRGQPLHELQRAHHQVRGSVAPRRLELQLHLSGGKDLLARQALGSALDVQVQNIE